MNNFVVHICLSSLGRLGTKQLNWRVWQHGRLSSKMEATSHSMLLCNMTATSAIKRWSLFPFTLNLGWLCYLPWPTKHMKSHYVSSRPKPQETLKTSSCLLGGCSQTTMEGRQSSLLQDKRQRKDNTVADNQHKLPNMWVKPSWNFQPSQCPSWTQPHQWAQQNHH